MPPLSIKRAANRKTFTNRNFFAGFLDTEPPAVSGGAHAVAASKRQMGPERAPTGLVAGYFTDPEGNLIGVAGPA